MEFFCYHRDRPGSGALRERLLEQHWSYMDGFADRLIARGPTFGEDDGAGPSGSVHLVDLPDPLSARAFAFEEPNYQAGVYGSVLLLRWRNLLGRTMWQFPGGRTGGHRYLVLGLGLESGLGESGLGEPGDVLPSVVDELIAYGPLLSDDGGTWLGTAALLRAPDPVAARAVLHPHRYADVGVHRWQFGGRAPTLPLQCNQCACEVPESAMKTLYLRNVPDEVVERLERLAALAGTSVSALAVRELSEVSRRVDNEAVLDALPDLGIAMADVVADLDDARSDR